MRFILTSLIINIKRIVRGKAFIFIMLMLPITILICSYLLQDKVKIIAIKAGIIWDENDSYAADIYENIVKSDGIIFQKFDTIDEAEVLVKTGKLECAYAIKPHMGEQIEQGNVRGIITLIKSPQTVSHAIINEMLYAAVIKATSAQITTNELAKKLGVDYNETRKIITEKTVAYYNSDDKINFVESDDNYEKGSSVEQFDVGQIIAKRLLHGIIAMFILTAVIFMLPRFIDEKQNGFAKKLGLLGLYKYYFSLLLAFFFISTAFGFLALYAVKLLYPLGLESMDVEMPILCIYVLTISMLGLFVINLLNKSDWIYSSFIFVLTINIFFGGIIIDLREISSALGNLSDCFITNNYINAVIYGNGNMAISAFFLLFLTIGTGLAINKTALQK